MLYSILFALLPCLASSSPIASSVVQTNGLQFQLNGQPFTFAGANTWEVGYHDENYIAQTISGAKSLGFPVTRVACWHEKDLAHAVDPGPTWFQEWVDGVPTINDGPNGLQLLDKAVKAAEDAGIKYIMILTNNWQDFGGMDTYTVNILNQTLTNVTHHSFYTEPQIVASFKRYVDYIVARYKDSPAVFSWELINEARCQEKEFCQGSEVLTQWTDMMSTYVKTLDPYHMVSFGGMGFENNGASADYDFNYDGDSGEDFKSIIALKNVDWASIHWYTKNDTHAEEDYGMTWFKGHNDLAVAANKPMIVGEWGVSRDSDEVSYQDISKAYETYILDPSQSPSIQGALFWSCDLWGGTCPYNGDPYALCSGDWQYQDLVAGFSKSMAQKRP